MGALVKLIPVGRYFAKVDDADFEFLSSYKWYARGAQSAYGNVYALAFAVNEAGKRKGVYMHRLLVPGAALVDHIDHDSLNNQRSNLRPATHSGNRANSRRKMVGRAVTASQYLGLRLIGGRWYASIRKGNSTRNLGAFLDEREAALAYDAAARETFGEFAKLNFPGEKYSGDWKRPKWLGPNFKASDYLGVTQCKRSKVNPWRSMILSKGKTLCLGSFPTQIDAAMAYDEAARRLRGPDARTNFPAQG